MYFGDEVSLHGDVLAENARRFSNVEGLEDMANEYQLRADDANAARDAYDQQIISAVHSFL